MDAKVEPPCSSLKSSEPSRYWSPPRRPGPKPPQPAPPEEFVASPAVRRRKPPCAALRKPPEPASTRAAAASSASAPRRAPRVPLLPQVPRRRSPSSRRQSRYCGLLHRRRPLHRSRCRGGRASRPPYFAGTLTTPSFSSRQGPAPLLQPPSRSGPGPLGENPPVHFGPARFGPESFFRLCDFAFI